MVASILDRLPLGNSVLIVSSRALLGVLGA